jgi:invasion protein IalB
VTAFPRRLAGLLLPLAIAVLPATALAQTTSGPSVGKGPPAQVQMAEVTIATDGEGLPPLRTTSGDWQVRCEKPADAPAERCALMQSVVASKPQGVGLSVIVLNPPTPNPRMLRVLVPLGVLLPGGLGLRIDDTDIGVTGFARCLPNGCVAEVALSDDVLGKLRKGNKAVFVVFQTPDLAIGIPVSLTGFSKGFDSL